MWAIVGTTGRCYSLYVGYTGTMWAVSTFMWYDTTSTGDVNPICGLLELQCGPFNYLKGLLQLMNGLLQPYMDYCQRRFRHSEAYKKV